MNPDGSVNPEHNSLMELRLQHGTFRLDIAAIDKAFVATISREFPTYPATCSGTVAGSVGPKLGEALSRVPGCSWLCF